MKNKINGTQIDYYFICKTKLWLFSHNIQLEHQSENVKLGKILHEDSFKREKDYLIDNLIILDFNFGAITDTFKFGLWAENGNFATYLFRDNSETYICAEESVSGGVFGDGVNLEFAKIRYDGSQFNIVDKYYFAGSDPQEEDFIKLNSVGIYDDTGAFAGFPYLVDYCHGFAG